MPAGPASAPSTVVPQAAANTATTTSPVPRSLMPCILMTPVAHRVVVAVEIRRPGSSVGTIGGTGICSSRRCVPHTKSAMLGLMAVVDSQPALLTLDDVRRAAALLEGVARRTPALPAAELAEQVGATAVIAKCESLQRTGSFKFRGAYHLMSLLSPAERAAGVCTISSGNHAQAVALAARLLGISARVLMPSDAPPEKVEGTRRYGADVSFYDRHSMPQVEAGRRFQAECGNTFVTAYDDPRIGAGAGTATLELFDDAGECDVLLAPIGGGGGLTGHATVARGLAPECRVVAVEPAGGPLSRSLRAGHRVAGDMPRTVADGLRLTTTGEYCFAVLRERVDEVVAVDDGDITAAMLFAFHHLKLVVEPSGAAALAAVLGGKVDVRGQRVGLLLTGGNISLDRFRLLTEGAATA